MGLRYRKSINLLPGVKLNISKSGFSTSIGKPGNTLNVSSRGTRSTIGIPGTGLSYSQMLTKRRSGRGRRTSRQRAQETRLEMKQKFGLNDREIDRLLKLYRKHPRKFSRMSQEEMMAYARRRRYSSGNGESTMGSRFSKPILVIILIILILAFLGSFSQK